MLPPEHPLAALQARAALATGWPALHLASPAEDRLLAALAALEETLGPLPQAELIEPAEPGDLARLRIDLPGLTEPSWAALREALRALGLDAALTPADPPGTREAKDQLALVADVIEPDATVDPGAPDAAPDAAPVPSNGIPALLWASPEGDGLWLPDLTEEDPDPVGAALASELVAEVGAISPELRLPPHQLIAFVRHRPTGRRGLRLAIPAAILDPLPGAAVHALRQAVVGAVGRVIARRADSHDALAPDLSWDPRFGFALTAWRIGAPGPALPGDSPLTIPVDPPADPLAAAAAGLLDRVGALEIQVHPNPATAHDAVALALAEALHGLPLAGGASRWLKGPTPVFAPTWRVDPDDLPEILPMLAALPDRADVAAVRIVPVDPIGLEHRAPFLDPAWRWLGGRWFVRWRDGALDRDALPITRDRRPEPTDADAIASLTSALQRVPGLTAENAPRPIIDDAERPGLAIRLPAATPPWALSWAIGAIAGALPRDFSSVVDLALPPSGPIVVLWRRAPERGTPVWGYTG